MTSLWLYFLFPVAWAVLRGEYQDLAYTKVTLSSAQYFWSFCLSYSFWFWFCSVLCRAPKWLQNTHIMGCLTVDRLTFSFELPTLINRKYNLCVCLHCMTNAFEFYGLISRKTRFYNNFSNLYSCIIFCIEDLSESRSRGVGSYDSRPTDGWGDSFRQSKSIEDFWWSSRKFYWSPLVVYMRFWVSPENFHVSHGLKSDH